MQKTNDKPDYVWINILISVTINWTFVFVSDLFVISFKPDMSSYLQQVKPKLQRKWTSDINIILTLGSVLFSYCRFCEAPGLLVFRQHERYRESQTNRNIQNQQQGPRAVTKVFCNEMASSFYVTCVLVSCDRYFHQEHLKHLLRQYFMFVIRRNFPWNCSLFLILFQNSCFWNVGGNLVIIFLRACICRYSICQLHHLN